MIPATLRAVFSEQIQEDEDGVLKNWERKSKKVEINTRSHVGRVKTYG